MSSPYTDSFPQSKKMHVMLIVISKMSVGVREIVNGWLSHVYVDLLWTVYLSRVYHALPLVTTDNKLLFPQAQKEQVGNENVLMEEKLRYFIYSLNHISSPIRDYRHI